MTVSGGVTLGYDGRGNLTSSGPSSYVYTSENRLAKVGADTLSYHPSGDLMLMTLGGVEARFDHLGGQMITEYNGSNVVQRRYVYGPGDDEPLLWYEGSGTSQRYWLHADERGSVVAVSDGSGNAVGLNSYDEYGIPAATNMGRFQYTGQAWLPGIGLYYYKARMYSPTLGRFMQTDPIGYGDGMNMYGYVGADPINATDPSGLSCHPSSKKDTGCPASEGGPGGGGGGTITVTAPPPDWVRRNVEIMMRAAMMAFQARSAQGGNPPDGPDIVVHGKRPSHNSAPINVAQKEEPEESKWDKFKDCAAAQYGFGDGETPTGLDFGKMVSEVGALPIPKSLVGVPVIGNSSRFTNAVSLIPHKLGIRLNTGMQILGSGRVFGVLGRANVIVGSAMLAWDVASIAICTARE